MQAAFHNVGHRSSSNEDERYFCKHRARDTTSHAHTDANLYILTLAQKRIWKFLSTLGPHHAAESRDHMNRQSGKLIVTRLGRGTLVEFARGALVKLEGKKVNHPAHN